jgi:parallel beta-helix repeat protein
MMKSPRKHKHLALLSFCALFFTIGSFSVQAATYHVATTGNDGHTCGSSQSITTPKKTIASAVACLSPGDTLFIRSGTYMETIDLGTKSGTAGNYIRLAAYPGEKVIIQPNLAYAIVPRALVYLIFEGLILDGINAPNNYFFTIDYGSHDVILRNLEIRNWKGNGIIVGADNVQILNCKIHNQVSLGKERWYGIYFHHGDNGLIEGNVIYNNPGGGIHAYPGTISNLIIRRNTVYDNNTMATSNVEGILVFEGWMNGVPQIITGVQVYNNVVYNNSTAETGGLSGGIRVSNGPDGTKVWNNTVYGNKGWGINIQAGTSAPTNTVVQNNIVFGNTSGQIVNAGIGSIVDHNLTTNPSFSNAAGFNFNLQAGSAAIDGGIYLSQVTTDFKNIRRPQGFTHDIGAYEGSSGTALLSPPINLRVQ